MDELLDNKHDALTYIGVLNFTDMAKENLVYPLRDIPLTSEHYANDDESIIIIRTGQIKEYAEKCFEIEGIGRKMMISDK